MSDRDLLKQARDALEQSAGVWMLATKTRREIDDAIIAIDARLAQPEAHHGHYKVGNEFAPFHRSASHVPPDYRDGWNACYEAAKAQPAEPRCQCGDRAASACPGAWEEGCDLGANEAHAMLVDECEVFHAALDKSVKVVARGQPAGQAQSAGGWLRAVDEAMAVAHLGVANAADDYATARKKLADLIQWNINVATDPRVNGGYKLMPAEQAQPAVPDGWRLVPVEPTDEMYAAWFDAGDAGTVTFAVRYRAMLAVAPEREG